MKVEMRRLRGPVPELGPGWIRDGQGKRIGLEMVLLWLRLQVRWEKPGSRPVRKEPGR
ncbi:MAG TPA: hypothetical protein VNO81_10375 [Candidatus Nitrosotenuis sp.]|nr:hypothetical protein [Candidatus Nitrosotenuis sp.]